MKLRLNGNALRLRLNQAEVGHLSKTGYVESTTEFGPGSSLSYILETSTKTLALQVVLQNGDIRVRVPVADAQDWITTERVEIAGEQQLDTGKKLSILIEKDFQCIHKEHKDPGAFPNPLSQGA